jgi:hypothetical protein
MFLPREQPPFHNASHSIAKFGILKRRGESARILKACTPIVIVSAHVWPSEANAPDQALSCDSS